MSVTSTLLVLERLREWRGGETAMDGEFVIVEARLARSGGVWPAAMAAARIAARSASRERALAFMASCRATVSVSTGVGGMVSEVVVVIEMIR